MLLGLKHLRKTLCPEGRWECMWGRDDETKSLGGGEISVALCYSCDLRGRPEPTLHYCSTQQLPDTEPGLGLGVAVPTWLSVPVSYQVWGKLGWLIVLVWGKPGWLIVLEAAPGWQRKSHHLCFFIWSEAAGLHVSTLLSGTLDQEER